MKIAKYQIGTPGPFEVRVNAPGESRAAEPADEEMPRRRYDCHSYQHCLELAAALNWESFTCDGCSGVANESLLWRVGQAIRRDSIAKALCATPKISMISGSFNCASVRPQSATTQHGELLKPTEVLVTSDRTNR